MARSEHGEKVLMLRWKVIDEQDGVMTHFRKIIIQVTLITMVVCFSQVRFHYVEGMS